MVMCRLLASLVATHGELPPDRRMVIPDGLSDDLAAADR